jgi:hypothetical protein
MTQAAHPWSFFQVGASRMDDAFDDCVKYSRFVPVFLRQVDPGMLQVMMIFNDQDRSGALTLSASFGSGLMGTEMLSAAKHDIPGGGCYIS